MSGPESSSSEQFPSELTDKVTNFHEKLKNLEELLDPLLSRTTIEAKESLGSADKARYDLSLSYGLSSMLWAYMLTQGKSRRGNHVSGNKGDIIAKAKTQIPSAGEDPKDTALKHELNRIRDYMTRVQQLEDRVKRPKVVPGAAKRFVRNALYDPEEKKDETRDKVVNSR